MKRSLAIMLASLFAVPIQAQQSAPAQQQVQQVECRDVAATGNYLAPNETLINGKPCRPAGAPLQVVDPTSKFLTPPKAPVTPSTPPASASPATLPPSGANQASGGSVPAQQNQQTNPKGLLLEDGTPVHLVLGENLSSANAVTGQTVAFEAVDDIVVKGFLVIPRGSTAWATVTEAEHKRRMARGGKLNLNIDKVRLADGEKALLRAVKEGKGGGHTGAMTGAIVATSLVVWPAAPFFLFMHGKDITIPKGTQITAFIQGDVTLDESRFEKQLAVSK